MPAQPPVEVVVPAVLQPQPLSAAGAEPGRPFFDPSLEPPTSAPFAPILNICSGESASFERTVMSDCAAPALGEENLICMSYLLFGATVMLPPGTWNAGSELLKLIVAAISPVFSMVTVFVAEPPDFTSPRSTPSLGACTFGSGMWTTEAWNATFEGATT